MSIILNAKIRRSIFWLIILVLIVAGLIFTFRPQPIPVDLIKVTQGPMIVTVEEEGETRVKDVYMLSAPVTGHMLRIDAEVGDDVIAAETLVAQIRPINPEFLDKRSEEEARAAIKTAEASLALTEAQLVEAQSEFDFAVTELERANKLIQQQVIPQRALDNAKRDYKSKRAGVNTAKAALRARQFELAQARAHLVSPADVQINDQDCQCVTILSPITGKILQVLHESEGVISMGTPLVEIGDPANLEIVVDFLSSDAVRIQPGQRVIIEEWGGESALQGTVRKIEPFGFTKTSALGIDEQRVNVIIDLSDPTEKWQRLAHGYQIEARVVLWESENVSKVPLTSLFRDNDNWAVYVEQENRAKLQHVKLGQRNGLEAEILEGLPEGSQVISHPSNQIVDGIRVKPRD
ncbi:MAG: HlyD family efflux transporter periplasmic adaptor subunit [Gammaproteobacteria bacterium]|nr:HlyD family efflux transporter periplasmic adaptor subunit [Gammaproteobacteria bacterium]